jgi:hypothetical protein
LPVAAATPRHGGRRPTGAKAQVEPATPREQRAPLARKSADGRRDDQSPRETPATSEERFGINPHVAAKSRWARIAALQRNKRFLERYREAFEARRRGDLDVVFPFGTYQLRALGLVRVEPPPA